MLYLTNGISIPSIRLGKQTQSIRNTRSERNPPPTLRKREYSTISNCGSRSKIGNTRNREKSAKSGKTTRSPRNHRKAPHRWDRQCKRQRIHRRVHIHPSFQAKFLQFIHRKDLPIIPVGIQPKRQRDNHHQCPALPPVHTHRKAPRRLQVRLLRHIPARVLPERPVLSHRTPRAKVHLRFRRSHPVICPRNFRVVNQALLRLHIPAQYRR